MKLSVLLTVYNGERYLREAMASVLAQTFKDFELLVGLNGCTDGSEKIAREFESDKRVKVSVFDRKGRVITLNRLLLESTSELVAIQDADDIWLPEKLAKQIPYLSKFDVVGTYIDYIDEDGKFLKPGPLKCSTDSQIKAAMLKGDNQIANSSSVFVAKHVRQICGWDDDRFTGVHDFDLWIRLARSGKIFYNVPEVLVQHRLHNNSSFNSAGNNDFLSALLKKYGIKA
jgi:glycosyltransferase involved in cell wall biosynthesis